MRARPKVIAFLIVLAGAGASHAVDLEFGVDTLPVLIDDSDRIVQASRIEMVRSRSDSVVAYAATVVAPISSAADAASRVVVLVPQSLELPQSALSGAESILFLEGPVDARTAASFVDSANSPVFWLVGGNYGRIAPSPERVAAIRAYEAFGADERKLPWARDQLRDGDELLQRSALIELAKPQYFNDAETYELLTRAALDGGTTNETKDLALEVLEVSGSPRALIPLRDIVVADATAVGRRAVAIRAIGRIDGGEAVLRELEQNQDRTINGPARTELERLSGASASLPTTASVLAGLASTDIQVRAQALQDLKTLRPTENTIRSVAPLMEPAATTNLGERAALVDHLTALNNAEAATLLANVAGDRSQREEIRNAAIIGLGMMDASVSAAALRKLGADLEDGELKDLVGSLAE